MVSGDVHELGSSVDQRHRSSWMVTLAVLSALAVLSVLAAGCTRAAPPDDPDGSGAPSTTADAGTPTPRSTPTLAHVRPGDAIDIHRLPRGEPPEVEYLDGTVMVLPDGSRVPLHNQQVPREFAHEAPGRFYFGFAPYGGGWLTSTDSMGAMLQLHRRDGSLADSWLEAGDVVATSVDGRRALGGIFRDRGMLVGPDGTARRLPGSPVGFLGRDVVLTRGYQVHVGYPGRGFTRVSGLRAATATASSGRLVIADSKRAGPGVFDLVSGSPILLAPQATSPFHGPGGVTLHGLSPDGVHVVATQHKPRPQTLVVADVKDGEIVTAAPGVVLQQPPYWEDPQHFLVVAGDRILRIGVDGTLERASGPAENRYGFVLPGPHL